MGKQKNHIQSQKQENFFGHPLEYKMIRDMFDAITADCKGDKNQFALDYINDTYGLLGHVTSIMLEGD